MKIVFRARLSRATFAGARDDASATFTLQASGAIKFEPVGVSARDREGGARQWSLDVTGLRLHAEFRPGWNDPPVAQFLSAQFAQKLVVETAAGTNVAADVVKAVLLAGTLRIANPVADKPGERRFLESLTPTGRYPDAILFEPAGLYVLADLPAAFFPPAPFSPAKSSDEDRCRVVLRLPQKDELDAETFDEGDELRPCWTISAQQFPDSPWNARTLVEAHALSLRPAPQDEAASFIDSVSVRPRGTEPTSCAVRLGRSPESDDVRWIARSIDVAVSLAAGTGAARTDEVHFRPDVLTGAFRENDRTSPVQFQALPRRAKTRPRWLTEAQLGEADYRLTLSPTAVQRLAPQSLVAHRGPVRAGRAGEPQEAWLCVEEGWLAVAGRELLVPLTTTSGMQQLSGNVDVFAMARALQGGSKQSPQTRLQISAIDFDGDNPPEGTTVSLTVPAGLYLWRPRVVLTTPPLWQRPVAAERPDAEPASEPELGARFVPSLLPGAEVKFEDFDPAAHFGPFVFVSRHATTLGQEKAATENAGTHLEAALQEVTTIGDDWSLGLSAEASVAWVRPAGLPLASGFPGDDSPRDDAAPDRRRDDPRDYAPLDDRRGFLPLCWAGNGPPAVRFGLVADEQVRLPSLAAPTAPWQIGQSAWRVDRAADGLNYFLTTLPGVEVPLQDGQAKLEAYRLRHANPALDESYGRITEDQEGRRLDAAGEADVTRVEGAVAFTFGQTAPQAATGWAPGTAVPVTDLVLEPNDLHGLRPSLKFAVDGVPVHLRRPTADDRWSDLVHLGLDVTWPEGFSPPVVRVVAHAPRKLAVIGGGQPLLVRPLKVGQGVLVADGRGELREGPDAGGRIRQRHRSGRVSERLTEARELGQADQGDRLRLELCGVSLGKLSELTPEELRHERWQLHDGEGKTPRLRGFPLLPLSLDEVGPAAVTLSAAWLDRESQDGSGLGSAAQVTLRFERDGNAGPFSKVTVLAGALDWLLPLPPGAVTDAVYVARVCARFAPDTALAGTSVPLQFERVTLALPFGQADLTKGDCRLVRDGADASLPWVLAFQAECPQADVGRTTLRHKISWNFVTPDRGDALPCGPFLLLWAVKPANDKLTTWDLRYGQAADVRPLDLKRYDLARFAAESAGAALLPAAVKAAAADLHRTSETGAGDLHAFLQERLLLLLKEWFDSDPGDPQPLIALLPSKEQAGWALRTKLPEKLDPLEIARLRRSVLESFAPTKGPAADWQARWHLQLHRDDVKKARLGVLGDVVLRPIRASATRLTFCISRDAYLPLEDRREVARLLRIDSLGGFLGAEVVHGDGGLALTRVAVQLQLIVRDRFRRDALGVWNVKRDSFLVREDRIGEASAFAGFGRTVHVGQQDVVWAAQDLEGSTTFLRWVPERNQLETFPLAQALKPPPRKARDVFPLSTRKVLLIDDRERVSEFTLVHPENVTAPPAEELVLQEPPLDQGKVVPVELVVTNYSFAGRQAAWTRKGDNQKGCWLHREGTALKPPLFTDKKLLRICFADNLLLAIADGAPAKLLVYDGAAREVALPLKDVTRVWAMDSLAGAPLVVAYAHKPADGPEALRLAWFRKRVDEWDETTVPALSLDLPFDKVDQLLAIAKGICAIRSGTRVALVRDVGDRLVLTDLDAGGLVPEEIDLLDSDIDEQTPVGDLLLRGPASRTLCTAVLNYSDLRPPELELSGKLVLHNDVRFYEGRKAEGGAAFQGDCTHRIDLFLDRAPVPLGLIFGSLTEDRYLAGVAQHVFRFSDGAERIWQVPQLVRLARLDRFAAVLGTEVKGEEAGKLVFDASCVAWVQESADTGRNPAAVPFDAHRRGGAAISNPLFGLRLQSRPAGAFDRACSVGLPFLASIAFARFGQGQGQRQPPRMLVPAAVPPGPPFASGAQYALLAPRLVDPRPPMEDRTSAGIDFLSRTLEGRWLDSEFLRYSLLPEPPGRHAATREPVAGPALSSLPEGQTDFIWPAFPEPPTSLPGELKDLAALRGLGAPSPRPPGAPPPARQHGNRAYLAAATLARKVSEVDGQREVTGPNLVEFPFHVELRSKFRHADELEQLLAGGGEFEDDEPRIDLQLVTYEAGEIRRLLRETYAVKPGMEPGPLEEALLEWARQRLRERSHFDEALLVRDFHAIIAVPAEPWVGAQELSTALPFAGKALPAADPRRVLPDEVSLAASAELTPVVFGARPLDDEGLAPPYSATRWRLAEGVGKEPGALCKAQKIDQPLHRGGYTSRHLVPFEVVASGQYPAPRGDRILPLPKAVEQTPETANPPTSLVRPPWWEVAAWSDRPGELMTSSFRVSENDGGKVRLSAEQSYTLRRSRTATLAGAGVWLEPAGLTLPRAWGPFGAAFRPIDLELIQTLVRTEVPAKEVRMYVVVDQTVHVSAPSASAAAANPVLVSVGGEPRPAFYLIAAKGWSPKVDALPKVYYAVRRAAGLGEQEQPLAEPPGQDELAMKARLDQILGADGRTYLKVEPEDDGRYVRSKTTPIDLGGLPEATYNLVKYTITKSAAGTTYELTSEPGPAICIAEVPSKSRIRPLKTSVAVLGYRAQDGADVFLAGYGQLGPEKFSAIEPVVSGTDVLGIDWRRKAKVRVIQRNPGLGAMKYEAVVTGPGGETYPYEVRQS